MPASVSIVVVPSTHAALLSAMYSTSILSIQEPASIAEKFTVGVSIQPLVSTEALTRGSTESTVTARTAESVDSVQDIV